MLDRSGGTFDFMTQTNQNPGGLTSRKSVWNQCRVTWSHPKHWGVNGYDEGHVSVQPPASLPPNGSLKLGWNRVWLAVIDGVMLACCLGTISNVYHDG